MSVGLMILDQIDLKLNLLIRKPFGQAAFGKKNQSDISAY
jgi:hypothetical protein